MSGAALIETGGDVVTYAPGSESTSNASGRVLIGQAGAISDGVDLEDSKQP